MSESNDGGYAERGGGGVAQPGGPNTSTGGDNRAGRSGSNNGGTVGNNSQGRNFSAYKAPPATNPYRRNVSTVKGPYQDMQTPYIDIGDDPYSEIDYRGNYVEPGWQDIGSAADWEAQGRPQITNGPDRDPRGNPGGAGGANSGQGGVGAGYWARGGTVRDPRAVNSGNGGRNIGEGGSGSESPGGPGGLQHHGGWATGGIGMNNPMSPGFAERQAAARLNKAEAPAPRPLPERPESFGANPVNIPRPVANPSAGPREGAGEGATYPTGGQPALLPNGEVNPAYNPDYQSPDPVTFSGRNWNFDPSMIQRGGRPNTAPTTPPLGGGGGHFQGRLNPFPRPPAPRPPRPGFGGGWQQWHGQHPQRPRPGGGYGGHPWADEEAGGFGGDQGIAVGEPNPGIPEPNPEPRPMNPELTPPPAPNFRGPRIGGSYQHQNAPGPVRSMSPANLAGSGQIRRFAQGGHLPGRGGYSDEGRTSDVFGLVGDRRGTADMELIEAPGGATITPMMDDSGDDAMRDTAVRHITAMLFGGKKGGHTGGGFKRGGGERVRNDGGFSGPDQGDSNANQAASSAMRQNRSFANEGGGGGGPPDNAGTDQPKGWQDGHTVPQESNPGSNRQSFQGNTYNQNANTNSMYAFQQGGGTENENSAGSNSGNSNNRWLGTDYGGNGGNSNPRRPNPRWRRPPPQRGSGGTAGSGFNSPDTGEEAI